MKKMTFSMLALALLAFGACTSDDMLVTDESSTSIAEGEGYLSFTINLPTEASTRAANDNFDDGTADEYAVQDASLLLFEGTSEATATFANFYTLGISNFESVGTTTDQITTKATYTQKISRPNGDNKLYALVVLNGMGVFNNNLTAPTEFAGITLEGATLSKLQSTAWTPTSLDKVTGSYGFYMTNAPLSSKPGGSTDPASPTVTTLAEISSSNIKATATEASAVPVNIYVERGVAKVSVTQGSGFGTLNLAGTNYGVSLTGFILDYTNQSMYPVRNTTTGDAWWSYKSEDTSVSNPYRFAGSSAVADGLYRTYWATDPNYTATGGLDRVAEKAPTTSTTAASLTSISTPLYCLENTFNVANQNKDETTRAIIAVTISDEDGDIESDGGFYCINGDKSKIYSYDNAVAYAKNVYMTLHDVQEGLATYTAGADDFESSHLSIAIDADLPTDASTLTIAFNYRNNTLTASEFSDGKIPDVFVQGTDTYNDVLQTMEDMQFAFYQKGISYYPVLIKHFGDDLTPWNADVAQEENESYYGTNKEQNWLGRYGVLRNNWYELNVTDVTSVGYATIPDAEHEADDPIESYIAVQINVLSWAKRSQDVSL